jgi:hypothetical protein
MQTNVSSRDAADEECGRLLDVLDEVCLVKVVEKYANSPLGVCKMERGPYGRDSIMGAANRGVTQHHGSMRLVTTRECDLFL